MKVELQLPVGLGEHAVRLYRVIEMPAPPVPGLFIKPSPGEVLLPVHRVVYHPYSDVYVVERTAAYSGTSAEDIQATVDSAEELGWRRSRRAAWQDAGVVNPWVPWEGGE